METIDVEPVIGHAKADAANAVLSAGRNFKRLLAWLATIWRVLVAAIPAVIAQPA